MEKNISHVSEDFLSKALFTCAYFCMFISPFDGTEICFFMASVILALSFMSIVKQKQQQQITKQTNKQPQNMFKNV